MEEKTENDSVNFTNAQFKEIQNFLRSYLRIKALSGIKEDETERNVRLLDSANYSQEEIAKILHLSQPTVSRVLTGKTTRKREKSEPP